MPHQSIDIADKQIGVFRMPPMQSKHVKRIPFPSLACSELNIVFPSVTEMPTPMHLDFHISDDMRHHEMNIKAGVRFDEFEK